MKRQPRFSATSKLRPGQMVGDHMVTNGPTLVLVKKPKIDKKAKLEMMTLIIQDRLPPYWELHVTYGHASASGYRINIDEIDSLCRAFEEAGFNRPKCMKGGPTRITLEATRDRSLTSKTRQVS